MDWPLLGGVALLGFASSLVNGLLGAGGAVVLIPLFLYGLPALVGRRLETHFVTGLTLIASIGSTIGGPLGHHRAGNLSLGPMWRHGPLLAAGALLGAVISAWVPGRSLLILFGCVTVGSIALLVLPVPASPEARPRQLLAAVLLFGVGLMGGALGVGAGFLIIPVLIHALRMSSRSAAGSGLAVSGFAIVPALAGKALTGQVPWGLAPVLLIASVGGSLLGATISGHMPEPVLRYGLIGVMILTGVRVWADLLGH